MSNEYISRYFHSFQAKRKDEGWGPTLDLDSASWVSRGEHHHLTLAVFILSAAHRLPFPAAQPNSSGINESPPDGRHLASRRILPHLQDREKWPQLSSKAESSFTERFWQLKATCNHLVTNMPGDGSWSHVAYSIPHLYCKLNWARFQKS